jgi:hypothetical protein
MELAKKNVVYTLTGIENIVARSEGSMDLYAAAESPAAVVIVHGYRDAGFEKMLGCKFKDMGWTTSWARLLAVSGINAIAYTNTDPVADLHSVLDYARSQFDRVGILATSGHGPLALSVLDRVDCAALITPYTNGEMAPKFGFAAPAHEVRWDVPLFIARGGEDEMPGLNAALDRFVADAIAANAPLTFVNHPNAKHAFDLVDDSETTRGIVKMVLEFLAGLSSRA